MTEKRLSDQLREIADKLAVSEQFGNMVSRYVPEYVANLEAQAATLMNLKTWLENLRGATIELIKSGQRHEVEMSTTYKGRIAELALIENILKLINKDEGKQ